MTNKQQIIKSFQLINQSKNLKTKVVINDWSLWWKLLKQHLQTIKIDCQVLKKYCLQLTNFKNHFSLNNLLAMAHYIQLVQCYPNRVCEIENQVKKKTNNPLFFQNHFQAEQSDLNEQIDFDDQNQFNDDDDFNEQEQVQGQWFDQAEALDVQQSIFQTNKSDQDYDVVQELLKDVGKYGNIFSPEEEVAYFKKLKNAKDQKTKKYYRDKIAKRNLRLVVVIAKRYSKIYRYVFADLIMEGIKGLLRAIDKFEVEWDYRFSTYATIWILQAIRRGVGANVAIIKIPDNINEEIRLINKASAMWKNEYHQEPTYEQLSDFIKQTWKKTFSPNKIKDLKSYRKEVASLNKKIGQDEDDQVLDFIVDDNQDAIQYSDQNLLHRYLSDLLNQQFDHIERIYLALTTRIQLKINDRFKIVDQVINRCDLDRLISAEDKAYVITIIEAANRKFHLQCPCVQVINSNKSNHIIKKTLSQCKQTKKLTLSQIKFWMQKQIANYDKLFGATNSKDQTIYKKGYLKPFEIDQKVNLTKAQLNAITYQCPIWTRDRLKPIERKIKIKLETLRTNQRLSTFALELNLID